MYAHRTITLSGPDGYGRRIPPDRLGPLLTQITPAVRSSVRMRLLGRSNVPGKRSGWLAAAADVRFVDYSGNGDTVLHFEVPTLGDAAPELYRQAELWPTRPAPDLTGFDLLAEVIGEIGARNRDSDAFDRPLLQQVRRFEEVFDRHVDRLALGELVGRPKRPPVVDAPLVAAARELCDITPPPRRVRVVGVLDMLWVSRQGFRLRLTGEPPEVGGVLVHGDPAALHILLNRQVVVEGKAVYRPSGRVLRLDAEHVQDWNTEPGIWASIPAALGGAVEAGAIRVRQTPQTGVNAILGQWPGDETDDEIFVALERLS